MQTIQHCPLCNSTQLDPFLTCKDFTSSNEQFQLRKCQSCGLVITTPRPETEAMPTYYQSNKYISHTGRPSGPLDQIYLIVRNFTLKWKINLIRRSKKTITILDYGCGTGEFLRCCQDQAWQIAGVEPSAEARQKAQRLTGINIASDLHEVNEKFDVITLWHVLEHVAELKETVSKIAQRLNPDGLLIVAVPNHASPDASFYKEHWAAYDVPRHLWHFTKSTMAALLGTAHLRITKIKPMKLDAYYVSLLSEKYLSDNHISPGVILRGTIRGLLSNLRARKSMNFSSLIYIATK